MKIITFIFLTFSSLISFAQNNSFYDSLNTLYSNDRYLFEKFHQYKKGDGFIQGMKNEFETLENDSLEQYAIIAFYNNAYGYKWVNKEQLTELIRTVINNSSSSRIKKLAIEVKRNREQGFIGKSLPSIKLKNAYGEFIDVRDIKSPYIVIDLWATWCAPCLKDMVNVPTLKKKYNNIEFYSISFDKDFKRMEKFVKKKEYNWPIVFAGEDHELWEYFEVRALPQYFIVNQDREIISSTVNNLEDELELLNSMNE
jgi:thiol-disulfide isomerase/thioredoxin